MCVFSFPRLWLVCFEIGAFPINVLKISRLCSIWILRKMHWSRLTYICKNVISLIIINFPKYFTFHVGRYVKFHESLLNLNCNTITLFVATENGKLPPKSSLFSAFGGISKYVTYSIQHHQFYACYFLIMINVRPLFHFPFFFSNCETESFGNCRFVFIFFYIQLHFLIFTF